MSLKGIISISGLAGLYKVLAQTKSGFIVEALNDKKRLPVASTQRISMLEDISVFTTADDLPLKEVMLKLIEHEEKNQLIDPKSDPEKLRAFFKTIIPDYDPERVYPSDIKKIVTWFHLIKDIVLIEDEPEATVEESEVSDKEAPAEDKKKAPAKVKKKESAESAPKKKEEAEEAPKKKSKPAAAKKTALNDKDEIPGKAKKKPASK